MEGEKFLEICRVGPFLFDQFFPNSRIILANLKQSRNTATQSWQKKRKHTRWQEKVKEKEKRSDFFYEKERKNRKWIL